MTPSDAPVRYCCFRLGERMLAVDAAPLRRVMTVESVTPLPRTRSALLGLVAEGSRAVPIYDTAVLAGAAAGARPRYAMLLEDGDDVLAFGCDEVLGFAVAPAGAAAVVLREREVATFGRGRLFDLARESTVLAESPLEEGRKHP